MPEPPLVAAGRRGRLLHDPGLDIVEPVRFHARIVARPCGGRRASYTAESTPPERCASRTSAPGTASHDGAAGAGKLSGSMSRAAGRVNTDIRSGVGAG